MNAPAAGQLHVVFGTGQVGRALTAHLAGLGIPVRAVSRSRPAAPPGGADWRAADAADPEAAADAAKGATVIYQCLNAPYTQWPERFPPLQRGVLAAAERTGALLVSLENLYGYGPTGGRPMTEDLPLAATTVKGRTRAAMTAELLAAADAGRVRIAIGRASDFFGPGVTQGSTLGERVWIGVASSCITGGLVDGSALLEARRRDRAVLRIAGVRVGYLHQRLLWIISAVFDVSGEPWTVGSALRDLREASIDLTAMMPGVAPARTRLARATESLALLEEALAIAVSLGTQTTEAGRFEQLDYALRSNSFYAWLKSASMAPRIHDEYSELANGAADALDAVQTQFRFFAVRGGETWRYGQLPQSTPVTHSSRRLPVDAMTRKQHQLGRLLLHPARPAIMQVIAMMLDS